MFSIVSVSRQHYFFQRAALAPAISSRRSSNSSMPFANQFAPAASTIHSSCCEDRFILFKGIVSPEGSSSERSKSCTISLPQCGQSPSYRTESAPCKGSETLAELSLPYPRGPHQSFLIECGPTLDRYRYALHHSHLGSEPLTWLSSGSTQS